MPVLAIANQKGGVAKTATAACLAACLELMGQRVLAIDADPQGNLSMAMGVTPVPAQATTYDLLLEPKVTVGDCAVAVPWGQVRVVPANPRLAEAEVELAAAHDRRLRLRDKLSKRLPYDYVIIDTPPSLGFLTLNALAAASGVVIPVQPSYLALQGLRQLLDTISKAREHGNPDLRVLGVLLTMYDPRTLHTQDVEARLREHFADLVFPTAIRRSVAFDYATVVGQPLVVHRPGSAAAQAYWTVAEEVMKRA